MKVVIHPRYFGLIEDREGEVFARCVDWNKIPRISGLEESFIEKWGDYLCWIALCSFTELREDFIEKHSEKIHWPTVYECQNFSDEFFVKHWKKVEGHFKLYSSAFKKTKYYPGEFQVCKRAEKLGLRLTEGGGVVNL